VNLGRPRPPDTLDLARAEIEKSEAGKELLAEQQKHWDTMNLAGNVRFEKAEAPLKKCLKDTELLKADIRGLEAQYERNERRRLRDPLLIFLFALLVGAVATAIVASIVYGIVASKTKK
jgi:hypothetical protein